ncbi:MAG: SUMF1/EgtB/PvdO family nonheme iron enzyme [Holophagales bacterium]|nr:SUMF1/EgtB/PvdO family nonheme iron enzyme [Holophagales bacterium]
MPTKVQSARVHAATALALVLAFAIAFPALAGEPPYPILLVHGLNSSHEQWISDGTVSALASRYGMSLQLTEEQFFRFCLNYDDDHERNNLNYETISIGDPPSDTSVDIVAVMPTSSTPGAAVQRFFLVTFDVSQTGTLGGDAVDSNEEAIIKQGKAVGIAVKRILELTGAPKVILVGHSMGGLAARAYLQWQHFPPGIPGAFWAEPSEPSGGHRIAKLVTLGTPHRGSNLAEMDAALVGFIDSSGNAARDLAYWHPWIFNPEPDSTPFLFGGNESTVPPYIPGPGLPGFYSRDVDCNGTSGNDVLGINGGSGGTDNPLMPLPTDVEYVWIIGDHYDFPFSDGDCAVLAERQYLSSPGESIVIDAAHTSLCVLGGCTETKAFDVLLEALDEPDWYVPASRGGAWPIRESRITGFITHQWNPESDQDDDWFALELPAGSPQGVTVDREGQPGQAHPDLRLLEITTETGTPVASCVGTGTSVLSTEFMVPGGTGTVRVLLHIRGIAADHSVLEDPCNSQVQSTRRPYRVSISAASSFKDLSVTKAGGGTGSINSTPAGINNCVSSCTASFAYGTNVTLTATPLTGSTFAGWSGACTGTGSCTVAMTEARNVVATFSGAGGITGSASPNPVNVMMASTISVDVKDGAGNTVPFNTPVTFSTGFPGYFTGNGASAATSPSTVYTNVSGQTWIYFSSDTVGTANITASAPNCTPRIIPIEIVDPNADARIQLSVGYQGSNSGGTTYSVQAFVTHQDGSPVSYAWVTFGTSAGILRNSDGDEGTSGIDEQAGSLGVATVSLTVAASGAVTVTGRYGGSTAATTFTAQVGGTVGGVITPDRTLGSGAGTIFGLAYTPDGSRLIAGRSGALTAWNTSGYSEAWFIVPQNSTGNEVSVSPSGGLVALATSRGAEVRNVSNGSYSCNAAVSDPLTAQLLTWTSNSSLASAGIRHAFLHPGSCIAGTPFADVAFDARGRMDFSAARGLIAACSQDGYLYVWNTSGSQVRKENIVAGYDAYDAAFSSDGAKVAAVGFIDSPIVKVFNTTTWAATSYMAQNLGSRWIYAATFLDNDTKLAVGGDSSIEILNVADGSSFAHAAVSGKIYEMDWNPSTGELAAAGVSGYVYLFRPLAPPDTAGPVISVTTPAENHATNQSSVLTSGLVTDQTGVASFTVNGAPVSLGGDGSFSTTVSLLEGQNTISYHAVDAASGANASDELRHVTYMVDRTAPVISGCAIAPPTAAPGTTFLLTCTVVDGDTGVASVSATVRAAGGGAVIAVPMTATGGNIFSGVVNSGGFEVGVYFNDVTAIDSSPQANSATVAGVAGFSIAGPQTLTVTKAGTGTGSITSSPAGIACGTGCSFSFTYGTTVALTATPESGSTFGGWTGDPDCTDGTVAMGGPRSCTANFSLPVQVPSVTTGAALGIGQYVATLNGSVNPNGASTTTAFDYGTTTAYGATVTAQPLTGTSTQAVSASPALLCGTTYHFRARATNSAGTAYGNDASFPTSACTCTSFTIAPTSASASAAAGSQSVAVTGSPAACVGGSWSATGNGSWLAVAPTAGSGPATVTVSWEANTGTVRSGNATVAGNTFSVNQAGGASASGQSFWSLAPCRLLDTRGAAGVFGGPAIGAAGTPDRSFPLADGACGVPVDAIALSVNVTVVTPNAAGDLLVYPGDVADPGDATSVAFGSGRTRAAMTILKLAGDDHGTVKVRNRASGPLDLLLDVNGYLSSHPEGGQEITVALPGGVPLVMVKIPAGTFQMGSPTTERNRYDNETLHQVTLTSDYYIGKYEVTQAQWQAVMGTNPSSFISCGGNCPVEHVSWDDIRGANGFIAKLNELLGTTKFRLPTEAEWERAARGGTQARFSFGDALDGDDVCGANAGASPFVWWCGNAGNTIHAVGTKGANGYGLYDVHGNVWEWIEDRYGDYPTTAQTNPPGPTTAPTVCFGAAAGTPTSSTRAPPFATTPTRASASTT